MGSSCPSSFTAPLRLAIIPARRSVSGALSPPGLRWERSAEKCALRVGCSLVKRSSTSSTSDEGSDQLVETYPALVLPEAALEHELLAERHGRRPLHGRWLPPTRDAERWAQPKHEIRNVCLRDMTLSVRVKLRPRLRQVLYV